MICPISMIYLKNCPNQTCDYGLIMAKQQTLSMEQAGNYKKAGNYKITLSTVQY